MNNWEKLIYQKKKQLNKYPYGEIISLFFRYKKFIDSKTSDKIKLLELGCGGGNNLWFFAEQNCEVVGIDWSKTACMHAEELLIKRGQKGKIYCMDFAEIDKTIGEFDIVIDRAATYCGDLFERQIWIDNVYKIMKNGSIIISTSYSKNDPTFLRYFSEKNFSNKINEDTFTDFNYGPFKDSGKTSFVDINSLHKIYSKFETISLMQIDEKKIIPREDDIYAHSIFAYVGKKIIF